MLIIPQETIFSKWEMHKRQSEKMAKKLAKCKNISPSRVARMLTCGDTLGMAYCPSCQKTHIVHNSQCRDRLCPLCSWRLSIKRYHEMLEVLDYLKPQMDNKRVAMLTLTVRNVKPQDLRQCLADLSKAWKRLHQSKIFRSVWGWARCTEITYNSQTKTMHPHMHILIITEENAADIASMMGQLKAGWKAAARLKYNPIIDLREAYSKNGDRDIIACAGEAFAYSIKPATTAAMSLSHLAIFADSIAGYRFIGYGGSIKAARVALGIVDTEDTEDSHSEEICTCGTPLEHMVLAWSAGGYRRLQREEVGI